MLKNTQPSILDRMSKIMIGVYLKPEVKTLAEKLADAQGKRLSEYVRGLIIQDLDKRSVFTDQLKGK